ncbi:TPA: hypothetical protein RHW64_000546 [Escherichia coli]|uniref:hypothetical protein n=1 Tax=Escherichia TaxID=561 RepID=UPI0007A5E90F|nr:MULTISPECIES: hypothetical protein [Escherichia]EGO6650628.1 hypothetical protein [Escherichia coli]EGO6727061.1 hypothetical protein [Escherichia coli]EGO9653053.1 hypothetical protein [Escherichia coli]EGQ2066367.1 hypothetical protein [Escherichia coli]EGS1752944.1 hypothetical protein [Escherichia coli]
MFKQKKTRRLISKAKPGKSSLHWSERPVSTWKEADIKEYEQLMLEMYEYVYMDSEMADLRDNWRYIVEDGELIHERIAEPAGLFLAYDGAPEYGIDLRPYRENGNPLPEQYRIGYRHNLGAWPLPGHAPDEQQTPEQGKQNE